MMKIIDDKGRLFGKINVIDFLVILFLLCFIPMFYFGYKIAVKKPTVVVEKKETIEKEIYCKFVKLEPEILKSIAVGDREFDRDGLAVGEIIWLGEARPFQYKFDIGGGKIEFKEATILKDLPVRLKLKVSIKGNSLYYGDNDKQVMINSPFEFKTDKYKVSAIPDIEKTGKSEKIENTKLDLYVILKGLDEETLKLISVGDRELDAKGDITAEILSIGKIEVDTRDINLGGGMFVLGENGNKKQLSVKMRINCEIQGDALYFKGERLEFNSLFEFKTNKYTVMGKMAKGYELLPSPLQEKWVQIQVKFKGLIPEVAKVVEEGNIERDTSGKIVGRIKTIINKKPSEMLVLTSKEDKIAKVSNPFLTDIDIYLDICSIEKDGVFYFKNYPLKMGNTITFTTDLYSIYSISGVIVGMVSQ